MSPLGADLDEFRRHVRSSRSSIRRLGGHKENHAMAKGQKRSNKEIKKPKQKKEAPAAPATFEKGLTSSAGTMKKTKKS
jgi:hypothetical protein